jgi:sulfite exporter TauE/SafE
VSRARFSPAAKEIADNVQSLMLTLAGGFGIGLASTLHCAGMCGGLTASLMLAGSANGAGDSARVVALTHLGRISAYAAAGAAVGALGAPAISWLDRELAFRLVQWAGAVALMWIGLSTAGLLPPLSGIDRILLPVSERVARAARPLPGRHSAAFAAGLAWGLMPCAMVYGALFTAMLTGSPSGGAAVMAAFGLGTLPGLIAAAAGFRTLAYAATRRHLRLAAGLAIGVLGFLTVWAPHKHQDAICEPGERAALTQINITR